MTTLAQIKKAVQPLLQRNPDLALINRFVVIKPVHSCLDGQRSVRTAGAGLRYHLGA
jgi:hypothetical protein